jgi:hypothetical protein
MTACQQCGTTMPIPTGQAGRKRFCSVECRKAAWRQRHRDHTVPTLGGQHRCPHCRQPLAVISVLVPAAAAHIQPPGVTHA